MNSVLRQPGESLIIGETLRLTVLWIKGNYVCLQVEGDDRSIRRIIDLNETELIAEATA